REESLCDKVVGFYGSRIRDYLEVSPQCPVLLILPDQEKSFAVESLVEELKLVETVEILVLPGRHGFANRCAKDYSKDSSVIAQKRMVEFFERESDGFL
ncbi:MAG TPA: dienelactone hydrolase family protein, partial [Bacillota bacterium]|nr:dienelactone hydrolase family protein [Bacillota bacterium]